MTTPDNTEQPGWPWLGAYERHPDLAGARPVLAEFGMVSTPHHLATTIGLDVLRSGGNAVDAAVAASAALMVTVPMQCSPGGDAVWLIRSPEGAVMALDATGRSAAKANAGVLRSQGMDMISHRSPYAVSVPGAVDGWAIALRRCGTRPLADLLEPAARLAERGFFVSRHLHASFRAAQPALDAWGAMRLWSKDGSPPALYSRLRQPELAETLRLIGRSDGRALYEGPLAEAIVAAVRDRGGWLARDDLAQHQSEWVAPLESPFRGLALYTSPPATQGVALLQAAKIVETLAPQALDPGPPESTHVLIEAVAAALADRDRCVADRSRMTVQPESLLTSTNIDRIVSGFDSRCAGPRQVDLGHLTGRGDTAHLAVVDADGWAVSLIQSVFFDFGTGIPVETGGFTLQNRGAAFSLVAGAVNELMPRLRPPHTLTPTLACRDEKLSLVLGCMGGDGQVQTQLQLLASLLDGGLDPQQAVSRPRWYLDRSAHPVSRVLVERGIGAATIDGLRKRGHEVSVLGTTEDIMGHAQVIAVELSGALVGAADPRSDGQAAGW